MARQASKRNSMLTEPDAEGEAEQEAPAKTTLEEKVAKMGGNIRPLQQDVRKAKDDIDKLVLERKAINAKIKEKRESMANLLGSKRAFDLASEYVDLTDNQKDGFDTAYIIARESLGAPVKGAQADLFNEGNDDG